MFGDEYSKISEDYTWRNPSVVVGLPFCLKLYETAEFKDYCPELANRGFSPQEKLNKFVDNKIEEFQKLIRKGKLTESVVKNGASKIVEQLYITCFLGAKIGEDDGSFDALAVYDPRSDAIYFDTYCAAMFYLVVIDNPAFSNNRAFNIPEQL